jgi:hypothetical protein
MEGSRDIEDASPRMLVEQFSWELKAQQHTEADSEAFDQLRQDLIAERERHARPRQHEIRRLEAHFKETR